MLSTIPATILSSDGLFPNTLPSFSDDFTSWDYFEPAFTSFEQGVESVFLAMQSPAPEPVTPHDSGSGSDKSKPDSPNSSFGSDEPNLNNNDCLNAGSDDLTINERKRKRMISNRDSARRSRMRKQKHLENMRSQANQLKVENRDLSNRVHLVTGHCQLVQRNNEMLRTESILLQQRLENIRQILLARQLQQQLYNSSAWPCNMNYVEQRPQMIFNQPIINHH
ncbi:bZIP transcription factor 11-like [Lycium ferocissimum]|uniref:bZIP transcription factor 11-like n=1 Tax=Lycium ferocissimum TaxID=112874 RepID=UPI002815BCB6|nr:bZIP transcription factor 11-like [Lycium ferocissimum]